MKTVAQTIILTILTVFGLTSCDNKIQTKTEKPTTTADMSISAINTGQSTTVSALKTKTNQEIHQDTNQNDFVFYPNDTTKFIARLLMQWPTEEPMDKLDTGKWFGFFMTSEGSNCYISETKIKMIRDNGLYSVKLINNDNHPIILIQGLDFLNTGNILQSVNPLNLHGLGNPKDTMKFDFLGINYKIYTTVDTDKVNSNWKYYRFFLETYRDGQLFTELLVANMGHNTSIVFAGDLDRDNFLDLIIDVGGDVGGIKSCSFSMNLYLSKLADNGHLLKAVGRCCYQPGC